jgi:hypothetical protein
MELVLYIYVSEENADVTLYFQLEGHCAQLWSSVGCDVRPMLETLDFPLLSEVAHSPSSLLRVTKVFFFVWVT